MIREVSLCKNNSALWKLSMLLRRLYYFSIIILPTTQPKKKKKMKETCWHFGTLHERHREAKMTHEENEWRNSHKYKPGRQLNKLIFTHTVSFSNTNVVCNDMNWN